MIRASIIRLIVIICCAVGLPVLCLGQSAAKLDSLTRELHLVKSDTGKVNVLNALSDLQWRNYNYQESGEYADSAFSIATKIKFKNGIATAYYNRGNISLGKDEYDDALKNCLSAIKIFEVTGNKKFLGKSYTTLGIIYYWSGNYTDALRNYQASFKAWEEIGDKGGMAICHNNIGTLYSDIGNKHEALDHYLKALEIKENLKDKRGMAMLYNNIGSMYIDQGNSVKAMNYLYQALKVGEELGDKSAISKATGNLGLISMNQNKYSDALKYFRQSLDIKEEIGDKYGIAGAYNNIGSVFLEENNNTEALKNFLEAFAIFEQLGNKPGMITSALNIGTIYRNLGNLPEASKYNRKALQLSEEIGDTSSMAVSHIQLAKVSQESDNVPEAQRNLSDALALLKNINNIREITSVYKELSDINCASADYHQALEYYKMYAVYKDSLTNESGNKLMAEMRTKYETDKKEVEIIKLETEKQFSALQLNMKDESLKRIHAEKAKIEFQNLLNAKQIDLMANEQELQQSEIEQKEANLLLQKAETEKQQKEVQLLSKESELQKLELKKQKLTKNYLLGGLGLVILLSMLAYNNYMTRQQLKFQKLRNKIASDLHDDVGSTLSSIAIFSDVAQHDSKEVGPLLQTINESSRKMLDAMGDIVWTINPENDQFEKIILRMKSFAFDLLGAKNIHFHFVADDQVAQIKLPMEVRKNLYLIFKEATNNLVKYSDADKAYFSIKEEDKYVSMVINDNGKGFDPGAGTPGNGLKNMHKRAEEIGAKLIVISEPGKGTNIQLKIAV
jgi:signal transduction histidine kinase